MLSLNRTRLRDFFSQPTSEYARPVVRRIVLGFAFFFLFIIILSADFLPDKISLQEGQVSEHDIIAPRTMSYVNTAKTKKLQEEVLASVANVYDLDAPVATAADEHVNIIFNLTRGAIADKTLNTPEQKLDKLKNSLQSAQISLPDSLLLSLLSLNEPKLTEYQQQTKNLLQKYFQRGIRVDELDISRKHLLLEAEEVFADKTAQNIVAGIGQTLLEPNYIQNIQETAERRKMALDTVKPVREAVMQGQVLIRKGDVVSGDQIHIMEELGMYKGQSNESRIFGLSVFVLLVIILTVGYLYRFARPVYENDLQLALFGLILCISLLLSKVAAHYFTDFSAPIATGSLLVAILIDTRLGMVTAVVMAVFFGVVVGNDMRAIFVALIGSTVGVYSVSKLSHGYSLTKTGLWIASVNFVVIISTGLIEQFSLEQIRDQCLMGMINGISAVIITTGLLPYMETLFKITTPIKLLDLAKPNHPLLQRLLLDAPGTYHHSVLVGNLAETAAEMIGADSVTVRVGAYYHDIGKIKRPYFFTENLENPDNPHDKLAPSLSTLIITSHIKDGLDLCRDYKIPPVIMDIVRQHHGTTLVSYFYKRASETEHSDCLVEADFRYEGPRPQTKEAALIMLADACEAAVRSLSKPNVNRVEAMVRKIIRERLHDNQLDECNLTLKDLNIIGDVFIRVLSGMFHTRIEYPEAIKELERKKQKNGNNNKSLSGRDDNTAAVGTNGDGSTKKGSGAL